MKTIVKTKFAKSLHEFPDLHKITDISKEQELKVLKVNGTYYIADTALIDQYKDLVMSRVFGYTKTSTNSVNWVYSGELPKDKVSNGFYTPFYKNNTDMKTIELKKKFRDVGINVLKIERINNGLMMHYYSFDELKNIRTPDGKVFFSTKEELLGFLTVMENRD